MAASRFEELSRLAERLSGLVERARLGETKKEFASPPSCVVAWAVIDRSDPINMRIGTGQTAYQAFEQSGIERDGLRLSYGEVDVTYSESATRKMQVDGLEAGMRHVFNPRPQPKKTSFKKKKKKSASKVNGKSNGSASG